MIFILRDCGVVHNVLYTYTQRCPVEKNAYLLDSPSEHYMLLLSLYAHAHVHIFVHICVEREFMVHICVYKCKWG